MRRERLERLLRDGGCLAAVSVGEWSLYRSRDRRRRKIASIGSPVVEVMRAEGALAPVPGTESELLVWSRRAETFMPSPTTGLKPSLPRLDEAPSGQVRCSLLTRTLLRTSDHALRRRLALAALNWRQDMSESEASGLGHGMNWSAILAGTRIDASFVSRANYVRMSGAADRLAVIRKALSKQELRLLDLMILTDATRHAIAQSLGESDSKIDKSGLRVLKQLSDLYACATTLPGQASPFV